MALVLSLYRKMKLPEIPNQITAEQAACKSSAYQPPHEANAEQLAEFLSMCYSAIHKAINHGWQSTELRLGYYDIYVLNEAQKVLTKDGYVISFRDSRWITLGISWSHYC